MSELIDLTGQRFGRLAVIKRDGWNKRDSATWLCQCDCGEKVVVDGYNLRSGNTRSCGCLRKEKTANLNKTGHLITFDGRTQNLSDWAKELGVHQTTIQKRLTKLGWPIERALTKRGKP